MFPVQSSKKKQPSYANDGILESLRGLSSDVGKTVTKDVAGRVAQDAFSALFGGAISGQELHPNQPITPERQSPQFRPEFLRPTPIKAEEAGLSQKIDAVRQELKMLSVSIKKFHAEVDKAVSEIPVNPGVYHLTFLERLRHVIASIRQQVDDSSLWLTMHTSRKKKQGYWNMYKKHGTTFGLSHERNVSTQAG